MRAPLRRQISNHLKLQKRAYNSSHNWRARRGRKNFGYWSLCFTSKKDTPSECPFLLVMRYAQIEPNRACKIWKRKAVICLFCKKRFKREYGFEILLRCFHVGRLVGRSKFPYLFAAREIIYTNYTCRANCEYHLFARQYTAKAVCTKQNKSELFRITRLVQICFLYQFCF